MKMLINETTRREREEQVKSAFNAGRIENNYEPDEEDTFLWRKYINGELTTYTLNKLVEMYRRTI